jgi:hypothetical protein
MVASSPIRSASRVAARNEPACSRPTAKKTTPSNSTEASNRTRSQ